MIPIDVQVTLSKVKVKLPFFEKRLSAKYIETNLLSNQYLMTLFAWNLPNLVHTVDVPREKMFPVNFLCHIVKGQGQNCCSLRNDDLHPMWCLLSILWSFVWWLPNCFHWLTLERCFLGLKVKVKLKVFTLALSPIYFINHLHDNYQFFFTVVATREWIIHCIYMYTTLFNFAPGVHLCFSDISCYYQIT